MISAEKLDYNLYLPPYRSLLNPGARYDYKTHRFEPFNPSDLGGSAVPRTTPKPSSIKMSYRSLLSDVGRTLSMKISGGSANQCESNPTSNSNGLFSLGLPLEVVDHIFSLVDDKESYKNCIYTNKVFYKFAKPHLYKDLKFTSTYRLAQFITYLRLNPEVGQYVRSIDLSGITPGIPLEEVWLEDGYGMDEEVDLKTIRNIRAGWRDWKYKTNPLFSIHSHQTSSNLTNVTSNSQASVNSGKSNSSTKSVTRFSKQLLFLRSRTKHFSKKFKNKKSRIESPIAVGDTSSHPKINKFLIDYATSRDVPIGYIIHMINLCPNIVSLDLGNLSLSTDYQVHKSMIRKFQTFDSMNNYPKDIRESIKGILYDDNALDYHIKRHDNGGVLSSASSMTSLNSGMNKPKKYNSLLPPLPQSLSEISYLNSGDGKVFLSDLNLKSINNNYLRRLTESEVVAAIIKVHGAVAKDFPTLQHINLSSVIWLNKALVRSLLYEFVNHDFLSMSGGLDNFDSDDAEEEESLCDLALACDASFDFSNSGMYKNLQWAQVIDLKSLDGCRIAKKIINNELYDDYEEFRRRDRIRRGRIAENYLH